MKKVPIEDYKAYTRPIPSRVDDSTGMVYVMSCDGGIICHCSNLSEAERITHCLNTHQMLLDALKTAYAGINDNKDNWQPNDNPPWNDEANIQITLTAGECQSVFDAIESASFVEVQE